MIAKATIWPNRQIVIYSMGPSWIRAVELGTLRGVTIPRTDERHLDGITEDPGELRRVRIRLEKKAKSYRSLGCKHYNPKVVNKIIKELRA